MVTVAGEHFAEVPVRLGRTKTFQRKQNCIAYPEARQ